MWPGFGALQSPPEPFLIDTTIIHQRSRFTNLFVVHLCQLNAPEHASGQHREVAVHVGEKLRRLREHEALTQRELADRAGLTVNAISRIERGETNARLSTMRKLAEALGVHPSEITGK